MEGNFQTSFIPKKSAPAPIAKRPRHSMTLATLISIIVLVVCILIAGATYGYHSYLTNKITSLNDQLEQQLEAFKSQDLTKLTKLDTQITTAQQLLSNHTALQLFFQEINSSTLQSIQFKSFSYNVTDSGITVSMSGSAPSFSAVALESAEFQKTDHSDYFSNVQFSNINLDNSGNVFFTLTAQVKSAPFLYKNIVAAASAPTLSQTDTHTNTQ